MQDNNLSFVSSKVFSKVINNTLYPCLIKLTARFKINYDLPNPVFPKIK